MINEQQGRKEQQLAGIRANRDISPQAGLPDRVRGKERVVS
jgi:hypothetical protein